MSPSGRGLVSTGKAIQQATDARLIGQWRITLQEDSQPEIGYRHDGSGADRCVALQGSPIRLSVAQRVLSPEYTE